LGIDFSLAPFPAETISLGAAFERLGVPKVGLHGSLAAAAILTEAIDRARFRRAGFSGLLLPVLEDATLAARAGEGTLTVKDLLLYSAVCGTGLDTVPLPGNTSAEQIAHAGRRHAPSARQAAHRSTPVPTRKPANPLAD
jgi:uncharacterized protein (UPF0210 family)